MSRTPAPKKIVQGDTDYDVIREAWILNGRAHQFDRQGDWGGAMYRVSDVTADYPDFYQAMSLGPTMFDDDSYHEKPLTEGWHLINRKWLKGRLIRKWNGRIIMRRPEIPNRL